MKMRCLGLLGLALLMEACTRAEDAFEPAAPPEPKTYLSGEELVSLYRANAFCYGYLDIEQTCSNAETFMDSAGSTLLIHRLEWIKWSYDKPSSLDAAMGQLLFIGTPVAPEAAEIDSPQHLEITEDGLCSSRQQSLEDARLITYQNIVNLSDPTIRTDTMPDESSKTIETWEMIERESKSNVFCSKYRWADGSTDTLYEDVFVDGAKSLNSNKIRLLPTPTQLPLRPSRTERKRYQ